MARSTRPRSRAALNAVIARHDALRGRVGRNDERMHLPRGSASTFRSTTAATSPIPTPRCAAFVAADARTPFDLWSGPLVRAALLKLAAQRHVLVFTAHHIVCDGWSTNIILQELAAALSGGSCRAARRRCREPPSFSRYATDEAASTAEKAADLAYLDVALPRPPAFAGAADGPAAAAAAVLCRRDLHHVGSSDASRLPAQDRGGDTARRSFRRCSRRCRS